MEVSQKSFDSSDAHMIYLMTWFSICWHDLAVDMNQNLLACFAAPTSIIKFVSTSMSPSSTFFVSICTFVPGKIVNWVPSIDHSLSLWVADADALPSLLRLYYICPFVPVKQVNWVPSCTVRTTSWHLGQCHLCQYMYFCTSKSSQLSSAYVNIHQHTSAYVSIRQNTSEYDIKTHTDKRQTKSTYIIVSRNQFWVSIRHRDAPPKVQWHSVQ
jgi:hypothetical protein